MKKDRVYVSLVRLAKAMKVDTSSVYRWCDHGFLPMYLVGNQRMVRRKFANKILSTWRKTCTPTEAAKLIGINQDTIYGYIERGVIGSVKMFGYNRVFLHSISKGREYASKVEERMHEKAVKMGKSPRCHRFTSEESLKLNHSRGRGVQNYSPANKKEKKILGSMVVCTIVDTSLYLGISVDSVRRMLDSGELEGISVFGKPLVLKKSINRYKGRKYKRKKKHK